MCPERQQRQRPQVWHGHEEERWHTLGKDAGTLGKDAGTLEKDAGIRGGGARGPWERARGAGAAGARGPQRGGLSGTPGRRARGDPGEEGARRPRGGTRRGNNALQTDAPSAAAGGEDSSRARRAAGVRPGPRSGRRARRSACDCSGLAVSPGDDGRARRSASAAAPASASSPGARPGLGRLQRSAWLRGGPARWRLSGGAHPRRPRAAGPSAGARAGTGWRVRARARRLRGEGRGPMEAGPGCGWGLCRGRGPGWGRVLWAGPLRVGVACWAGPAKMSTCAAGIWSRWRGRGVEGRRELLAGNLP